MYRGLLSPPPSPPHAPPSGTCLPPSPRAPLRGPPVPYPLPAPRRGTPGSPSAPRGHLSPAPSAWPASGAGAGSEKPAAEARLGDKNQSAAPWAPARLAPRRGHSPHARPRTATHPNTPTPSRTHACPHTRSRPRCLAPHAPSPPPLASGTRVISHPLPSTPPRRHARSIGTRRSRAHSRVKTRSLPSRSPSTRAPSLPTRPVNTRVRTPAPTGARPPRRSINTRRSRSAEHPLPHSRAVNTRRCPRTLTRQNTPPSREHAHPSRPLPLQG
uniref:Uncharacterized protein n=1 Tax=Mustela putorius furo TaxID=9669 RepID=M3Y5U9_MUSPF